MHTPHLKTLCRLPWLAALLLVGCGQPNQQPPGASGQQAVPVDVVTLHASPVTLESELSGRTSALRTAEVRPQVGGIILKRAFVEGSMVKAGQLLYQIDPALYQASVASAEATLAKSQAAELTAHLKAQRYDALLKAKAISQQDYDDAQATWKQSLADVASAKASLQTARINLAYTKVTAPISGRIGKSSFTEGALVSASQSTALATIQQIDNVYVDVSQSTTQLIQLKKQLAEGKLNAAQHQEANVKLSLDDGTAYPHPGKLEFTDVTVDESTGMVTLRIRVPNPEHELLPGMFIRAKVPQGERPNGVRVPQVAISRTSTGAASVMVVDADNKVQSREVQVSRVIGSDWLVESGLQAGERVVVAGLQKIRPGATVAPTEKSTAVSASASQTK